MANARLRGAIAAAGMTVSEFADKMLANTHVYGAPAGQSPVLHLRRIPGGRCFDHYARSFDRVWAAATRVDGSYTVPGPG